MKLFLVCVLCALTAPLLKVDEARERGDHDEARRIMSGIEREHDRHLPASFFAIQSEIELDAERTDAADLAAERCAARGGSNEARWRDLQRGSIAIVRAQKAAELAGQVESGPVALDAALHGVESALAHWRRAAERKESSPIALRNMERALKWQSELMARRRELSEKARKEGPPPPQPQDPQDPQPEGDGGQKEGRRDRTQLEEMGRGDLATLFDRLSAKDDRKRRARLKTRNANSAKGGKAW